MKIINLLKKYKALFSLHFLLTILITFLTISIIGTKVITSPYWGKTFNLSDGYVALYLGIIHIGGFIPILISGFVDVHGRRMGAIVSFTLICIFSTLISYAQSPIMFLVLSLCNQTFGYFLVNIMITMSSEYLSTKDRNAGQSALGISLSTGAVIPLVLAAILSKQGDNLIWRYMFRINGALIFMLPVLLLFLKETPDFIRQNKNTKEKILKSLTRLFTIPYKRVSILLSISTLFLFMGRLVIPAWFTYYMVRILHLTQTETTFLIILSGFVGIAGNPLGGYLAYKLGKYPGIIITCVLSFISGMAFYYSPADSDFLFYFLGISICAILVFGNAQHVLVNIIYTETYPSKIRTSALGLKSIGSSLGITASNFLVGFLIDELSISLSGSVIITSSSLLIAIPFILQLAKSTSNR